METIKKSFSVNTILINAVIAALSVAVIVTANQIVENSSSALYMTLVSVGVVGVLLALINIIFRSRIEVYEPTGSRIRKFSLNCNSATTNVNRLCQIMDGCKADELEALRKAESGDILVEVMYSKDSQFGAYQISNYVPYQYEVAVEWKEIESEMITNLKIIA